MTHDDPADIAPEVLSDPVDGTPEPPAEPQALVPAGERKLASPDPFRRYLSEVKRYPPLERDEEQALARLYRETGDREALFRLISANLMLVVRIAQSFRRAAHNLLDLVQEGNVGLMEAIERYDPDIGARLPTYAAFWIRAYMVKFLLDNVRLVRVGTTNARRKLLRNLQKEKARLEEMGFDVGPKLLAEKFGVSEADVIDVQKALHSRDVSLDAPLGEGSDGATHAEFLPALDPSVEDDVARQQLQSRAEETIAEFREGLGERERAILDERIISEDPRTLQELGDRFGVTREAARQSEGRLMKRLEAFLKDRLGDLGQIRIGPD